MQSGAVIGQCNLQVIYKFACSAGSDAERKRRNSFGAKRHKCQCFSAAPQTCSGEKVFNPNISSAAPQACAAKRAPTYSERLDKLRIFADEAAEELPQVFYRELNGGIILSPITKAHPQSDPKNRCLCWVNTGTRRRWDGALCCTAVRFCAVTGIYRTKS